MDTSVRCFKITETQSGNRQGVHFPGARSHHARYNNLHKSQNASELGLVSVFLCEYKPQLCTQEEPWIGRPLIPLNHNGILGSPAKRGWGLGSFKWQLWYVKLVYIKFDSCFPPFSLTPPQTLHAMILANVLWSAAFHHPGTFSFLASTCKAGLYLEKLLWFCSRQECTTKRSRKKETQMQAHPGGWENHDNQLWIFQKLHAQGWIRIIRSQ